MKRFLPYLRYLRGRRLALTFALIFGAVSGIVYGFGLPNVLNQVFPKIFTDAEGKVVVPVVKVGSLPKLTDSSGAIPEKPTAAEQEAENEANDRPPKFAAKEDQYALYIPLLFLVRAVSGFLNNFLMSYCGIGVLEALRVQLYRRLQYLPLSYFGKNRTGDLLSRLTADTQIIQQVITSSASDLVIQPLTLIAALYFLAHVALKNHEAGLFLASLAAVPACVFPVRFIGRKLLRRAEENQRLLGDISDLASQNLSAAREVRAFSLEEREIGLFQQTTKKLFRVQLKVVKYSQMLSPSIEVIASLGIAFSLYYTYYSGITLSVFVSIVGALFVCYEPMKKLGNLHSQFTKGTASLNRIEEVLNTPLSIAEPASPTPVGRLKGNIDFANVGFAYRTDEPVLQAITARIPAGTICALVGPSGAGKSTFANLVPRFYEVSSGGVTIDGIDLRAMRLADLRRNIALVSQEPVLFNDTIYQNLALGREGATREEIMTAARDAHADDFISKLPQGYDTKVGERGTLLSGGQKQRIAIARAFLRAAPILILDEHASALDSDSEAALQDSMKKLVVDKTVLIIAHRFSTIRDASMILVFDKGEIVAQGDHASLYAGNALYKSLYDRQAAAP